LSTPCTGSWNWPLEEAQEENDLADLTMTLLGGVADRSDTPGSATSATQRPVARRSVV